MLGYGCLLLVSSLAVGEAPAATPNPRVGGNEVTRHDVIMRQLPLYPGQILRRADLYTAERNLARLNLFVHDANKGARPTVAVLDPDGDCEYKDILVTVQETRPRSKFGLKYLWELEHLMARALADADGEVILYLEERRGTNPVIGAMLRWTEQTLDVYGALVGPVE